MIYLVRHGDSLSKDSDLERPLSEQGKNGILALGNMIAKAHIQIDNIFHSGIKRAEQTAEILASCLSFKKPISFRSGLEPMDSVNFLSSEIEREKQNSIFVGHLPFLSKLVSRLVIDDENNTIADFYSGSMICLKYEQERKWLIQWMLTPDLISK